MTYLPPRRAIDVRQVVAMLSTEGGHTVLALARRLDWAYDRCLLAADRAVERGYIEHVPDSPRRDTCPECGAERWELVVVPGRFYCRRCGVATEGPNTAAPSDPEPEQIDLFGDPEDDRDVVEVVSGAGEHSSYDGPPVYERPPVDEGEAWIADEDPGR